MIYTCLEMLESYSPLEPRLPEVCAFIHWRGYEALTPGKAESIAPGITTVLLEYETVSPETKFFELHQRCTDLQFLLSGEETIHFARKAGAVVRPYREENDDLLAEAVQDAVLQMDAGMVCVFFAQELHKPGLTAHAPCKNCKLVVKIRHEA